MPSVDRVPVLFVQEDMAAAIRDLPYARRDRYGKSLLTENVLWADVWIAERKENPTVWTGVIRDGELFLDQAKKGGFQHARGAQQTRPSLLGAGFYKIWLDAWTRPGEAVYAEDRFTKTDHFGDDDASRWKAPAVPPRKHWQDIAVKRPRGGGAARIAVRSRRFHWLYRLSRIAFALEQVLEARERNAVLVTSVRDQAAYLLSFLAAIQDSNTLALLVPMLNARRGSVPADPEKWPDWRKLREMQGLLHDAFVSSENFVLWGAGGNDEGVVDHQHANNLAHLLWRLVNERGFQDDVCACEQDLAMQHRALISRLPALLNRVPLAFESVEDDPRTGTPSPHGVAMRYGEAFARDFCRPFVDRLAAGAPSWVTPPPGAARPPPPSGHANSNAVKWLDGARKYCWAMLNTSSVFVGRSPADTKKMLEVMKQLEFNLFQVAEQEIEKYRQLGRSDVVEKIARNREILRADDARLKKAIGWSEYDEFTKLDAELQKARGNQPERIADALKRGNPAALYLLDGFEIFVKVLVARAAWQAFREEAAKHGATQPRRGSTEADAWIKTVDAAGTVLRSTAFKNFLKWTAGKLRPGLAGPLETYSDATGRWAGFASDVYAAWVYGGDVFSNAYGDKLLDKYMPEDAVTSYGFHLVIWGGKWLNGLGSTVLARTKIPIGYMLQGLGYMAQLIGEFGEAAVSIGGLEHKHFDRVHGSLTDAAREVHNRLARYGLDVYPSADAQRVKAMEASFDWRGLDRDRYRERFNVGA